jgi:hypothetical protein
MSGDVYELRARLERLREALLDCDYQYALAILDDLLRELEADDE